MKGWALTASIGLSRIALAVLFPMLFHLFLRNKSVKRQCLGSYSRSVQHLLHVTGLDGGFADFPNIMV